MFKYQLTVLLHRSLCRWIQFHLPIWTLNSIGVFEYPLRRLIHRCLYRWNEYWIPHWNTQFNSSVRVPTNSTPSSVSLPMNSISSSHLNTQFNSSVQVPTNSTPSSVSLPMNQHSTTLLYQLLNAFIQWIPTTNHRFHSSASSPMNVLSTTVVGKLGKTFPPKVDFPKNGVNFLLCHLRIFPQDWKGAKEKVLNEHKCWTIDVDFQLVPVTGLNFTLVHPLKLEFSIFETKDANCTWRIDFGRSTGLSQLGSHWKLEFSFFEANCAN